MFILHLKLYQSEDYGLEFPLPETTLGYYNCCLLIDYRTPGFSGSASPAREWRITLARAARKQTTPAAELWMGGWGLSLHGDGSLDPRSIAE